MHIPSFLSGAIASAVLCLSYPSISGQVNVASTAPDPTEAVELENVQVRVLRVRIPPHSKSQMHSHPNRVVIPLSVQRSRAVTSDGVVEERSRRPGQVFWAKANTHLTENLSDQMQETLIVEIKSEPR